MIAARAPVAAVVYGQEESKMHSQRSHLIIVPAVWLILALATAAIQAQSRRAAEEHYNRGNALGRQRELDRAIAEFDKAIEINPRLAGAWCSRGVARYLKGDPDGALADLNRAIALDPRHSMAHYNRAVIWLSQRELDKALADLSRAIEINPRFASAYNNRGQIHFVQCLALDGKLKDSLARLIKEVRQQKSAGR